MGKYDDIIDLPAHKSTKHPPMSRLNRAAQFAPFAALTGYDAMVQEEARLTDSQTELSEYQLEILNRKLFFIADILTGGDIPAVSVTYFRPDETKAGGSYETVTGKVKAVDITASALILYGSEDIENRHIEPIKIEFNKIMDIKGELVDGLND
ncbi:MAG: hypothetical protein IJ192_11900 [Clostridia bacterium]|nr:hypothetical protein [Clostridia bacterium]